MPHHLLWNKLLAESIDVLLVFALLVRIACWCERWAVLVESHDTVERSRSCGWHDKRLQPLGKLLRP